MKLDTAALLRLRWSAIASLLLVLAGAGVVTLARDALDLARREAASASAQRKEVNDRLSRATDEEQEIRQKIGRYQEIVALGHIGQEQRLAWVEEISRSKAQRKLLELEYEILPQKPADGILAPEGPSAGALEFVSSTMKLRMQLLHEEDLLGFLADLRANVKAMLHIRDCAIERIPRTGGDKPNSAQLHAECTIEWVTLKERK